MELAGTHGTTRSRADNILAARQFQFPADNSNKVGRAGRGVYFWAYAHSTAMAIQLASDWWEYASNRNRYQGDRNRNLAVLGVKLKPTDEDFLDTCTLEFQEQLFDAAEAQGCKTFVEFCQLYEWTVDELEQAVGKDYAVIAASVPTPHTDERSLVKALYGMCRCYVVRHARHDVVAEISEIASR